MTREAEISAGSDQMLRHVLIVGGTPGQWAATGVEQWKHRLADLGKVADHIGASWLTIRPYGPGSAATAVDRVADAPTASATARRTDIVGGCTVVADDEVDGRQRLVAAIESLRVAGTEITEATIAVALNSPALADPDLVVVLGPDHRLPPSLVWELAYSELVFFDVDWAELQPAHVEKAIDEFHHRHRRFGGLD
ncbi:MAG: undecaprenyl diphosphate synthase family protein [Ilumatobacteraceae bacterium]